jgi:riboflavin transporter FmnP
MKPDTLFSLSNGLAMIGWLLLIALPLQRANKIVFGIVITILAAIYTWLVFEEFKPGNLQNFRSLEGVAALFGNRKMLLAGWVHYLAFDLLAGVWIRNNAQKLHVHYGFVIPCLVFTFLLGPMGLLIYLVIRTLLKRRYFTENF